MTTEEINLLEKKYFQLLINIFEEKGTTFSKNILSQYSIRDNWGEYNGDMSFIQRGLESVIKGIIFNSVDWEICSTPEGSDCIFQTSKAVIHIDAKALKFDDPDSIGNKVNFAQNQTSCFTQEPLDYSGKLFTSNLPCFYQHKTYGNVPCLTYFLKLVYNLESELNSFRNFKLILCSLPNGQLNNILGTNHFQAGKTQTDLIRTSLRINYNLMPIDADNEFKWKRFHELYMI